MSGTVSIAIALDATAQSRRAPKDESFTSAAEDPRVARCEESVRRTFRRSRYYSDMQFAVDANTSEPDEVKPRGKFTPRHPIDVDLILTLPIEVLSKKNNEWLEAELWCGLQGGRVAAGDIIERKRARETSPALRSEPSPTVPAASAAPSASAGSATPAAPTAPAAPASTAQ